MPKVYAQFAVPNSAGTEPPKLKAPSNACDCHHHIYDAARFPPTWSGGMFQPNGRVEEYHLLQRRIGTTRSVVVTPAPYIGDNRVTLDAIARLGATARGVALLRPDVTDDELKALTDGGIRGLRFSQVPPAATTTFDMIEPLSKRVAAFGWHVQIYKGCRSNCGRRRPVESVPCAAGVRSSGAFAATCRYQSSSL
jgi:D-galactarolactone isomerase